MLGKRKLSPNNGDGEAGAGDTNKKPTSRKAQDHQQCEENSRAPSSENANAEITSSFPVDSPHSPSNQISENSEHLLPNTDDYELSVAEKDEIQLLTLLPDLVWCMFCEIVDDPAVLENLYNSSLFFHDYLSRRRTEFLFQNVCNSLLSAFEQDYYHTGIASHSALSDERDNCYKETLNLRLVCKFWNNAIENYYQNHAFHFQLRSDDDCDDVMMLNNLFHANLHLSSDETLNRGNLFLDHFKDTHANTSKNPFLGRSVKISFKEETGDSYSSKEISDVLTEYGKHIWYCSVLMDEFPTGLQCYLRVWNLMNLMPNLKVFCVQCFGYHKRQSLGYLPKLENEIQLKPLPVLENLQMISTKEVVPPIFDELIRSNGHVSIVDIDTKRLRYNYDMFKTPVRNLKTLAVSFYWESSLRKLDRDFVDWSLTTLHLNLEGSSSFMNWQRVFNVLQAKFQNTLTKLNLKLPIAEDKRNKDRIYLESHTFKLNLPLVSELSLEMKNLSCLDFLLPMSNSLIELDVKMTLINYTRASRALEKVERGETRIVKLLSCVKKPKQTNVWQLFPKLKNVKLNVWSHKEQHFGYAMSKIASMTLIRNSEKLD